MMDHRISHHSVFLFEMTFINCKNRLCRNIVIFKNMIYPVRRKFFMRFVGNVFDKITDFFFHLLRQADSKALFQDIVHAALA